MPKEKLPIELPEKIDLKTKGNPLDHQVEWRKISINGKNYKLETDLNIINPMKNSKDYDEQNICAAALSFYLIHLINDKLKKK